MNLRNSLTSQTTIRILATSYMGFGDLSTSMTILQKLRALGYKGQFEFIYSGGNKKIISLFQLPSDIPDIYFQATENIQFISMEAFLRARIENRIPRVSLGMTGALLDNPCQDILRENPDYLPALTAKDTPLCENPAIFSNTHTYYALESFPAYSSTPSRIFVPDDNRPYNLDDRNAYFTHTPYTLENRRTSLSVKIFIERIETRDINVLPIYGKNIRPLKGYSQFFMGNMLQIICGARYAQLYGPLELRKPLILAVFYDYMKEAKLLAKAIQTNEFSLQKLLEETNLSELDQIGFEHAKDTIQTLTLENAFSFTSLENFTHSITSLKSTDVVLLSMGTLPQPVFEGLYHHENMLPPIREGGGTLTSLLTTGRPHFRCGNPWEISLDLSPDATLKKTLEDFYVLNEGFCQGMWSWKQRPTLYQTFGQLIIESTKPSSPLTQYFQVIQQEATSPEKDRVRRALNDFAKREESKIPLETQMAIGSPEPLFTSSTTRRAEPTLFKQAVNLVGETAYSMLNRMRGWLPSSPSTPPQESMVDKSTFLRSQTSLPDMLTLANIALTFWHHRTPTLSPLDPTEKKSIKACLQDLEKLHQEITCTKARPVYDFALNDISPNPDQECVVSLFSQIERQYRDTLELGKQAIKTGKTAFKKNQLAKKLQMNLQSMKEILYVIHTYAHRLKLARTEKRLAIKRGKVLPPPSLSGIRSSYSF